MQSRVFPVPSVFFRHLCVIFQQREEIAAPLEAFCNRAIQANGRLLWLSDESLPLPGDAAAGRVIGDPRAWFAPPGSSANPDMRQLDDFIQESRNAGFSGVYLAVDLAWLLSTDYPERNLFFWETWVNERVEENALHVLCLYEMPRFSRSFLPYILFLHPFFWQSGRAYVNPHYLPSNWYSLFPMPQNLWLSPAQLPTPVPDAEPAKLSLENCLRVRSYLGHLANNLNNMLNVVAMKLDLVEHSPDFPAHLRSELAEIHAARTRMEQEIASLQKQFEDRVEFQKETERLRVQMYGAFPEPPASGAALAPAAKDGPSAPTVLLVDDEPSVLRLGERILTREGYRVRAFPDAVSALAEVEKSPFPFDVLVTDG